MQHVTAEGTALVKQAEDAASNKKVCRFSLFSNSLVLSSIFPYLSVSTVWLTWNKSNQNFLLF